MSSCVWVVALWVVVSLCVGVSLWVIMSVWFVMFVGFVVCLYVVFSRNCQVCRSLVVLGLVADGVVEVLCINNMNNHLKGPVACTHLSTSSTGRTVRGTTPTNCPAPSYSITTPQQPLTTALTTTASSTTL